jgi:hypothetical protein
LKPPPEKKFVGTPLCRDKRQNFTLFCSFYYEHRPHTGGCANCPACLYKYHASIFAIAFGMNPEACIDTSAKYFLVCVMSFSFCFSCMPTEIPPSWAGIGAVITACWTRQCFAKFLYEKLGYVNTGLYCRSVLPHCRRRRSAAA